MHLYFRGVISSEVSLKFIFDKVAAARLPVFVLGVLYFR